MWFNKHDPNTKGPLLSLNFNGVEVVKLKVQAVFYDYIYTRELRRHRGGQPITL